MRRLVVAIVLLARAGGLSCREAARRLGLARRTIDGWRHAWRERRGRVVPRGRRLRRASPETRRAVGVFVYGVGPGVGLDRLRAAFPAETRRELECILASRRRAYLRTAGFTLARLDWRRAGATWAIDYTDPDVPIAGGYCAILVVRDLASGATLLAAPVRSADADATVAALESLFREHGAPLVLKSDNGGHFTGGVVRALLDRWGVLHLLSPARTPTYNGAVESAIGWLKDGIAYVARRNGRADTWTIADIEEARRIANDTLRPRGASGPTPTESWRARVPIEDGERARFRARAAEVEHDLLASGARPRRARRDSIRRVADEYGILVMGRRRVRLPKRQLMRAKIR